MNITFNQIPCVTDGVVLRSDPPVTLFGSELPLPKTTFYKKLYPDAIAPKRSKDGDAGLDLFAREDIVVPSLPRELILDGVYSNHHVTKIDTGIAIQLPQGHVGLIWDRSSMGSKLLKTLGGVIDETYRGSLIVCLVNLSFKDYHVKAGDKVAQLIIQKYEKCDLVETDELSETERKDGGFGSSGR